MDRPFGDYQVISNPDGLRERRAYSKPKPPGVQRILGIGDSGMFGWDVPQEENYLARLERAYAGRPGLRLVEVLNAGTPGYNTQQEVEWLATRGLAFEPDIVVVGWCGNDYDAPFFLYQPVDYQAFEGSLLYRFVFERERFFQDTKPKVSIYTDFERDGIHPEVLSGMGEEGVRQSLRRLQGLSETHGFRVLVFGPMDDAAVAICKDVGLPCFNTYARIPVDAVPAEHRVHHMHPTAEGHAVLAEYLQAELDRLGWLTESPRKTWAADAP
jgi:lysophospholipase L1-like esterase